jgi:hypothetical protein
MNFRKVNGKKARRAGGAEGKQSRREKARKGKLPVRGKKQIARTQLSSFLRRYYCPSHHIAARYQAKDINCFTPTATFIITNDDIFIFFSFGYSSSRWIECQRRP